MPDLWKNVGRNWDPVVAPIGEHDADGLPDHSKSFFFRVAFGDDLRKRRNEHGIAAALLRLEDNGKLMFQRHGVRLHISGTSAAIESCTNPSAAQGGYVRPNEDYRLPSAAFFRRSSIST